MVLAVVIIFAVCQLPYHVIEIISLQVVAVNKDRFNEISFNIFQLKGLKNNFYYHSATGSIARLMKNDQSYLSALREYFILYATRGGSRGVTRVTSHPPPGAAAHFMLLLYIHIITRISIQTAGLAFGGTGLCSYRVRVVDGSCAEHSTVASYTVFICQQSYLLLFGVHPLTLSLQA